MLLDTLADGLSALHTAISQQKAPHEEAGWTVLRCAPLLPDIEDAKGYVLRGHGVAYLFAFPTIPELLHWAAFADVVPMFRAELAARGASSWESLAKDGGKAALELLHGIRDSIKLDHGRLVRTWCRNRKEPPIPLIYTWKQGPVSPEEAYGQLRSILAQMCLWALRAGVQDDGSLWSYLVGYVREVAGPRATGDVLKDVVTELWKGWGTPISREGFRAYISRTADRLHRQQTAEKRRPSYEEETESNRAAAARGKPRRHSTPDPPWTVDEVRRLLAAEHLVCSRRWLYWAIESGKVLSVGLHGPRVTPDGLVRIAENRPLLDEDGLEQVRELLGDRQRRRALVALLVKRKGITPRAARKWVKEHRDKGETWQEIAARAGVKPRRTG